MLANSEKIVELARDTIEDYVTSGIRKKPDNLPAELKEKRAGVFVSIKKKGNLRGCIGTIEATRENMAEEIISNAISACSRDPRFPPVAREELDELEISVDVLGEAEEVKGKDELDPDKYGVIVQKGSRTGLLLPNLEGVDTVDTQVDIARRKAGIPAGTDYKLYRFRVERYEV